MAKNVVIIDYDLGNVGSVAGAIEKLGHKAILTRDSGKIFEADRIILPGVGSFGDGIRNLQKYGLIDIIKECVDQKTIPLLGICLGMQILATKSFEHGQHLGLNLIEGEVVPFNNQNPHVKKLHIGWNDITIEKNVEIFKDIVDPVVYFVHGYHFVAKNSEHIIACSEHGKKFIAGVKKNNIIGLQFHPEKSQKDGLEILNNFIELEAC